MSALITKVFLLGPFLLYLLLMDLLTYMFIHSFIHLFSLLAMQISLLLFNLMSNIFTDPGLHNTRWLQRLNAQFSSNLGNAVKIFGSLMKDRLMKSDRAY